MIEIADGRAKLKPFALVQIFDQDKNPVIDLEEAAKKNDPRIGTVISVTGSEESPNAMKMALWVYKNDAGDLRLLAGGYRCKKCHHRYLTRVECCGQRTVIHAMPLFSSERRKQDIKEFESMADRNLVLDAFRNIKMMDPEMKTLPELPFLIYGETNGEGMIRNKEMNNEDPMEQFPEGIRDMVESIRARGSDLIENPPPGAHKLLIPLSTGTYWVARKDQMYGKITFI